MPGDEPIRSWLIGEWTTGLRDSIASMTGETPKTFVASGAPTTGEVVLWWIQPIGPSGATLSVGASPNVWHTIGNEVLKSAGIEDGDDANIKSTYLEIVGQSLAYLARAISGRARRELVCGEGSEQGEVPPNPIPVHLDFGGAQLTLLVYPSQALLDLCDTDLPAAPSAPPPPPSEKNAAEAKTYPKGLDLLLDVELPVSVSFGRAELPVKDVIKLTTGSIVELNRSISEPVEVIVNNVVIARGEVVVVEGNFGVRIKQVVSRQERLRVLR